MSFFKREFASFKLAFMGAHGVGEQIMQNGGAVGDGIGVYQYKKGLFADQLGDFFH